MRKIRNLLILTTTLVIGTTFKLSAQFDKKVSFQGNIGYAKPIGSRVIGKTDIEGTPYPFYNFSHGLQAVAGVRYNLNKHISTGVNFNVLSMYGYTNPRSNLKDNSNFLATGLGPVLKYHYLNRNHISLFALLELNVNYYQGVQDSYEYSLNDQGDYYYVDPLTVTEYMTMNSIIIRKSAVKIEPSFAMGFRRGLGLDLKINESISFLFEGTLNTIYNSGNEVVKVNSRFLSIGGGVKLSFFKTHSLL